MRQRTLGVALSGAAILFVTGGAADAAQLVADFNDLTTGALSGKAGGTGFTGNWSGSANPAVITGDLTSSLYNVPQGGTPQSVRGGNAGLRQNYRVPTASPTGTVWFSFLARTDLATDVSGLSFNAPTGTPFDNPGTVYAYFNGTTLNYQFGNGSNLTAAAQTTLTGTALVVGQFVIAGGSGADSVKLWVNPNLTANSNINAITPLYSSTAFNALDTITNIGAISSRDATATTGSGGIIDNIRISDGGGNANQAFADVTGVPEPGAAAVGLLAAAGFGLRRRRPTRRC